MAGGLDGGQYGRSAPQGNSWSPNYADVVQPYTRSASQSADYLQQLQAPDYLQYAMGIGADGRLVSGQATTTLNPNPNPAAYTGNRDVTTPSYSRTGYTPPGTYAAPYDGTPTTTVVNPNPNPSPLASGQWRAQYGGDVGTTFQPGTPAGQQPGAAGQWRAQYGGDVGTTFRPGTQGTTGTQYRPPYGADAAANTGNGQVRDPNYNGNATIQTPAWHPQPVQAMQYRQSDGTVATAGSPNAQGRGTAAGGGTFWQQQDATITAVNKKLGGTSVSPNMEYVIGAAGGIVGGNVIPPIGNALARSVLPDPSLVDRPGWFKVAANRMSRTVSDLSPSTTLSDASRTRLGASAEAADNTMASLSQRWQGAADGWRQRVANAWVDNFDASARAAKELALKRATAAEALPGLQTDANLANAAVDQFLKGVDVTKLAPEQRTALQALSETQSNARTALAEAEAMARTEQSGKTVGNLVKEASGSLVGNAIRGAGMAGVGMLVDNYLDRTAGNDHKYGLSATTALTIPAALAISRDKGWGVGLLTAGGFAVGGHFLGQAIESALPQNQQQSFSRALQPNGIDAFSMGTAIALPTNDIRTKLALVGAGWTLGRMQNTGAGEAALWGAGGTLAAMFVAPNPEMKALVGGIGVLGYLGTRFTNKDQDTGVNLNNDAWNAMKADQSTRTQGSMDNAIAKFVNLGTQTEGTLNFYWLDWMGKNRNFDSPLSANRGGAVLSAALGECRLSHGTVVPSDKTQSTFIPGTAGLDIGGDAYRYLLIAQNCLNNAQKNTQNQSEINDLKAVNDQVSNTINTKILGRHDMSSALDNMTGWYHQHLQDGGALTTRTLAAIQSNASKPGANPQFLAKLCRDAALMEMALAKFNIGHDAGGAATLMYGDRTNNNGQLDTGVFSLLAKAQQLDPNNPDTPQLQSLANDIGNQMPAAVRAQYANPHYNPLNVNNALPPVR